MLAKSSQPEPLYFPWLTVLPAMNANKPNLAYKHHLVKNIMASDNMTST
jgi:hypothetical protein